jgi:hypothetical protein
MAESKPSQPTSDCDVKMPNNPMDLHRALVLYQELNEQQKRTIREPLKTIGKLKIALVEAVAIRSWMPPNDKARLRMMEWIKMLRKHDAEQTRLRREQAAQAYTLP